MNIQELATLQQTVSQGKEDVLPFLLKRLEIQFNNDYIEGVQDALTERAKIGIQKYGTPLQTDNGRNPLVDTFQEALDLAMYAAQYTIERKQPSSLLLNMAIEILTEIYDQLILEINNGKI